MTKKIIALVVLWLILQLLITIQLSLITYRIYSRPKCYIINVGIKTNFHSMYENLINEKEFAQ